MSNRKLPTIPQGVRRQNCVSLPTANVHHSDGRYGVHLARALHHAGGVPGIVRASYEEGRCWSSKDGKALPSLPSGREFVPFEEPYKSQALAIWDAYIQHKKITYTHLPKVDVKYWRAIVSWIECYDLLLQLGIDAEETARMSVMEGPAFNEEYTKAWKLGVRAALSPDYMEIAVDVNNSVPPSCLFPWVLPRPTDLEEYSFADPLEIKGDIEDLLSVIEPYVRPVSDLGDVDYASWHTNSVCYYRGQKTTVREARLHVPYSPSWNFKFYPCPVQKDACETRDAVACDIFTLNSIKLLDQLTSEAVKVPGDCMYRGDPAPIASRFYAKHRNDYFVMVDIKKCGLTFPHKLLTAFGELLAEKSNRWFRLYSCFESAEVHGLGTLKRGYCLGMASRAASAIIAGLFLLFKEEMPWHLDGIFLNDDGVISTPCEPQYVLEAWGNFLERWGIPVSWEKSFWSTKLVFCEEYRGMRWMKEGIYARAVANITLKSVNWLHRMALAHTYTCLIHQRFGDALPDPLIKFLVDKSYDFVPRDVHQTGISYLPAEIGGLSIFPREDWSVADIAEHSVEWAERLCELIDLRDKYTDRLAPRKGNYALYIPTEDALMEGPFSLKMMLGNALYLPTDRHSSTWTLCREWDSYLKKFTAIVFKRVTNQVRWYMELVRRVPALGIYKVAWGEVETFKNPYLHSSDMRDYFYAHRGRPWDRIRVKGNPLTYPTPVNKTLDDFNAALELLSCVSNEPGRLLAEMSSEGYWPEQLLLHGTERYWRREPAQVDHIPIQWGPWTLKGKSTAWDWESTVLRNTDRNVYEQMMAIHYLFPHIELAEDCEDDGIDAYEEAYPSCIRNPRSYTRVVDGEKVDLAAPQVPLHNHMLHLDRWYVNEADLKDAVVGNGEWSGRLYASTRDMLDMVLDGIEPYNIEVDKLLDGLEVFDASKGYEEFALLVEGAKTDLHDAVESGKVKVEQVESLVDALLPEGIKLAQDDVFAEFGLTPLEGNAGDILYDLLHCGSIIEDDPAVDSDCPLRGGQSPSSDPPSFNWGGSVGESSSEYSDADSQASGEPL